MFTLLKSLFSLILPLSDSFPAPMTLFPFYFYLGLKADSSVLSISLYILTQESFYGVLCEKQAVTPHSEFE